MRSDHELAIVFGMNPRRGTPPTLPRKPQTPDTPEMVPSPEPPEGTPGGCTHAGICPFFKAETGGTASETPDLPGEAA